MSGKSFLVDLTKCTACRGCQIACKQWKKLPGEKTKNTGSHQNPPDFAFNTLRVVRFSEKEVDGKIQWFFTPDQCRHCLEAPCKTATNDPDAILIDEQTGAVVYTAKTAVVQDFEDSVGATGPNTGAWSTGRRYAPGRSRPPLSPWRFRRPPR